MATIKRNNCLNLLKVFACFGVVFIHITFPDPLGTIVKNIASFAVPLFFMIAGYYSFGCDCLSIKRKLKRILKILFFGFLCFFLYKCFSYIIQGTLFEWILSCLTIKALINCLVFCTIEWAVPLWYLIAMSETYIFWFFVTKNKHENIVKKGTFFLLILGLLLTVYVESYGYAWMYKINFILKALPWFLFGYQANEKWSHKLSTISNFALLLCAILGWTITLFFVFTDVAINFEFLGVIISSVSLFVLGINNPDIRINRLADYIGDTLSLYIYIFHPFISSFILSVTNRLLNTNNILYLYFHPVISLVATVVFSHIFILLMKKTKLEHLIR